MKIFIGLLSEYKRLGRQEWRHITCKEQLYGMHVEEIHLGVAPDQHLVELAKKRIRNV